MAVDEALAELVRQRAQHLCEYCLLPQAYSSTRFQIDHIVAEQHGGQSVSSNLALACFADNNHKGTNLAGVDPKSRKRVWLYNPRRQKWTRHFCYDVPVLQGRTPVGRATIAVLAINGPHRIMQRSALIAEGVFPLK